MPKGYKLPPGVVGESSRCCLLKDLSRSRLSLLKRAQKDFLKLDGGCLSSGSLHSVDC